LAFHGDQNIRRLDVAVDHAAVVCIGQSLQHVIGDLQRGLEVQPPIPPKERKQRLAIHILHGQVGELLACISDFVERDDVRMNERAAHLGLAMETLQKIRRLFG
jgi:hypothetical protein